MAKNALEQVKSYSDKIRLMVLSVLREECGRELKLVAKYNDEDFDWEQHNREFLEDYGDCSLEQLLKYCKHYYGLSNLEAVRERRQQHKEQKAARLNNN